MAGASEWVGLPSRDGLKRSIDDWDLFDLKKEGIESKLCDERSQLIGNEDHGRCKIENEGQVDQESAAQNDLMNSAQQQRVAIPGWSSIPHTSKTNRDYEPLICHLVFQVLPTAEMTTDVLACLLLPSIVSQICIRFSFVLTRCCPR